LAKHLYHVQELISSAFEARNGGGEPPFLFERTELQPGSFLTTLAKHKSGDTIGGDTGIDQARARDPEVVHTFLLYGVKP
jgi:hypothetical protein